jgi:hypothetical protein
VPCSFQKDRYGLQNQYILLLTDVPGRQEKSAFVWELNPFFERGNERNFVLSMETKITFN